MYCPVARLLLRGDQVRKKSAQLAGGQKVPEEQEAVRSSPSPGLAHSLAAHGHEEAQGENGVASFLGIKQENAVCPGKKTILCACMKPFLRPTIISQSFVLSAKYCKVLDKGLTHESSEQSRRENLKGRKRAVLSLVIQTATPRSSGRGECPPGQATPWQGSRLPSTCLGLNTGYRDLTQNSE